MLYQTLTTGSNFMPDLGAGIHHMYNSATKAYNADGLSYSDDVTQLRSDPLAAFQFPSSFFMYLYVNPSSTVHGTNNYECFFIKRISCKSSKETRIDSSIFFGLGVNKGSPALATVVLTYPTGTTSVGTIPYDTFSRVGVAFSSGVLIIYLGNTQVNTLSIGVSDVPNYVVSQFKPK